MTDDWWLLTLLGLTAIVIFGLGIYAGILKKKADDNWEKYDGKNS